MAVDRYDGGGDPDSPYFTDINVEPADLLEFADLLDGDLRAIKDAWERLRSDLLSPPHPNFPGAYLGGDFDYAGGRPMYPHSDGMPEAREFSRAYEKTLSAESMLMEDLIKGLETLRDAARTIHDGYVATDASNADQLDGAFAMYELSVVLDTFGQPEQGADGKGAGG